MNYETINKELTEILIAQQSVLLIGGLGTGKSYLAKDIIRKVALDKYNIQDPKISIISCYEGLNYEDLINGISTTIRAGNIEFIQKEKIFINAIQEANLNEEVPIFVLLDDIHKSNIYALLGDGVKCIGNRLSEITFNSGLTLKIPENFYVVATYNNAEAYENSFLSLILTKFAKFELSNDISIFKSKIVDEQSECFYHNIKCLLTEFFDDRLFANMYEQNRYMLGPTFFNSKGFIYRMKYQIIPLIKQYRLDGIVNKEIDHRIQAYEHCFQNMCTLDGLDQHRIKFPKYEQVNKNIFIDFESVTTPIINLLKRIRQQKLFSDEEIELYFLFNSAVWYREINEKGIVFLGNFACGSLGLEKITRMKGDFRKEYSEKNSFEINNKKYYFYNSILTNEYQQGIEYKEEYIGNQQTTSQKKIIMRILSIYYQKIIDKWKKWNIQSSSSQFDNLIQCAENEWGEFLKAISTIEGSKGKEKEANKKFREVLCDKLNILWTEIGDQIQYNGKSTKLEGVYMMNKVGIEPYNEYINAMNTLEVKQMILQGPPGTSKTYSAKEFIGFRILKKNLELSDDIENDSLNFEQLQQKYKDKEEKEFNLKEAMELHHICNYNDDFKYSKEAEKAMNECVKAEQEEKKYAEIDKKVKVAWDIVQFHPSYTYEDFVRGIKVSTKDKDDNSSEKYVSYDTVNKVLGNIACLAEKHKDVEFYLIIDEINRANISTVFGEMIYGLEYRGQKVETPYEIGTDATIEIPSNLYLIGTMNTADKSIGRIDYAIRRRFLFFEQLPNKEILKNYKSTEDAKKLFDLVERLFVEYINSEYRKDDVQIGHTYFLVDSSENNMLKMKFDYQILPILKEYYRDGILNLQIDSETDAFSILKRLIVGSENESDSFENILKFE